MNLASLPVLLAFLAGVDLTSKVSLLPRRLILHVSRITFVTSGDDQIVEQITKQLNKLIVRHQGHRFPRCHHVEREMALIKVAIDERTRTEVLNIVNIFRAKVIDVDPRSYIVEITGDEEKIDAIPQPAQTTWHQRNCPYRKSCNPSGRASAYAILVAARSLN